MKFISALTAVGLLFLLSGNLFAQDDDEGFEKDLLEVAVFGGVAVPMGGLGDWTSTNELGVTDLGTKPGFDVGVDVGLFLTTKLSLGFNFTFAQFAVDTDSLEATAMHHRIFSPGLYLKYFFFSESNLVPYLKGGVGVDVVKYVTRVKDNNDNSFVYRELSYDPAASVMLGGGLFYYTHDYGGLFLEASYRSGFTKDINGGFQDSDFTFGEQAGRLDIHAGITVFFGSDE